MFGTIRQVQKMAAAAGIAGAAALAIGCGSGSAASSRASAASPTTAAAPPPGSASKLAPVHGPYHPSVAPANFVSRIDNPYFPLKPGTTYLYKGVHENGVTPQTDREVVTHQTRKVLGVTAEVINDTVSSGGHPIERTFDWYAQDKYGNVWYMGEDTREMVHGHWVKMSDSWEGGLNGAQPGIIMPGHPRPGDRYRQEYFPGHAMDQAEVVGSGGPQTVPAGRYRQTLMTVETSPQVDPGVRERKFYVAGVGDIREHTVAGNHEQIRLVSVSH